MTKTTLPKASMLNANLDKYDYVDSFQGILNDENNQFTAADIGKAFFSSGPKWVGGLFALRNKIVAALGLKTSGSMVDRQAQLDNFKCEKGEQLGLFRVFERTENEVILGEDDAHLNFRVSLFLEPHQSISTQKVVTISTTVVYNNWFGRLYFLPVRPFHRIIVPTMLNGIKKALEKGATETK